MATVRKKTPAYRHYRPKNLAVVRIDRKDFYLGEYDSPASIAVGGVFGPRTNLDDQPMDSPMYTGANTVVQDLSLGQRLVYRSDTVSLKPVIVVETTLKSTAGVPNSLSAVLTFNGTGQGTVGYTNSGLAAGDTLRFALQADATGLATGMYNWSMTVTADYGGGNSSTTTYTGSHAVVNRASSTFGKGWWLDGLDQLVVSGSGALLVRGNGDTLWFKDNGSGYDKAAGDTLFSKVTSIGHDNLSRRTSVTGADPDGGGPLSAPVYAYGYNAVNSLTTETDPLGNVTTRAYDFLSRLTSVTGADPDGGGGLSAPVWTYTYGSNTLLATLTDPLSHDTDFGYDDYGRQTTVTNHEGKVTTTAYNLLDQVTSVTTPDPDGAGGVSASTTTYAYDYLNRLASTTDALSGVTAFTYDLLGRLTNLRDPVNNDTSWAYDNAGRVTMETNELNDTRSFFHDAAGNLTRKKDRNERVTQYTFDDLDRMTAELWISGGDPVPSLAVSTTTQGGPINEVQRVGYSISGMLMGGTFTLSFGGYTTSAINYNATAATVQTALEGLASIGSGNVSVAKTTDTISSKVWTITFQGSLGGANQSQVTVNNSSISYVGSKTDTQATDTNGSTGNEVQVVTLSNATDGTFRLAFAGQTTAPIAYNASAATVDTALEALQSVDTVTTSGSNGGPWTITFTGTHANVNVAQIQGDAAAAQSGSVARTISYTYDTASQLTSATDPDSTYAYTYDNIGRALTVSNSGTSGVPTVVLTSVYDAASNRTQLSATVGGTNDFKNDYTFDNLNRMTQVAQIGNGGNTVANKRANFAYNAIGQFTSVERQVKPSSTWNEVATTQFTYDTLNRVTGIDHKRSGTSLFTAYSYTYDFMDRITGITSQDGTVAYTYDKTSQLTGADYSYQTDETFTWDANGNPSGGGNSVSANNHLDSDGTYDYAYDDEGNLILRTKISDSSYTEYVWDHRNRLTSVTDKDMGGTPTMSATYAYDLYDRRIKKVVDLDGAGGGGSVTTRYVYEDEGITRVVLQFDGSNNLTHRYLHGPAVDQLLSDEDSTNALLWSATDHLGTPRDLVNNSGVTQNHIKFSGFGSVTAESASAVDFLMGFAGMDRDEETGASYSSARYTEKGRWKSQDPDGFGGGDANLNRYVNNSPSYAIDPTGRVTVIISIPPGETKKGIVEEPFTEMNKVLDDIIAKLKALSKDEYDKLMTAGKVFFAGKKFTGTLDQYIAQVAKEKESKTIVMSGSSYEEVMKKLKEISAGNKNPFDITGIIAHGIEDDGIPTGEMRVGDVVDTKTATDDMKTVGKSVPGKFIIVSCFYTDIDCKEHPGQTKPSSTIKGKILNGKLVGYVSSGALHFGPSEYYKTLVNTKTDKETVLTPGKSYEQFMRDQMPKRPQP